MYFETLIENAHPAIIETIIEDSVYHACLDGGEEVMQEMEAYSDLLLSETHDPTDEFELKIEEMLAPYLENASSVYGTFLMERGESSYDGVTTKPQPPKKLDFASQHNKDDKKWDDEIAKRSKKKQDDSKAAGKAQKKANRSAKFKSVKDKLAKAGSVVAKYSGAKALGGAIKKGYKKAGELRKAAGRKLTRMGAGMYKKGVEKQSHTNINKGGIRRVVGKAAMTAGNVVKKAKIGRYGGKKK